MAITIWWPRRCWGPFEARAALREPDEDANAPAGKPRTRATALVRLAAGRGPEMRHLEGRGLLLVLTQDASFLREMASTHGSSNSRFSSFATATT